MILKFEDKAIGIVGDIHKDFGVLNRLLKKVENSVIFVIGDCGFGFSDTKIPKIKSMISKTFTAFLEKRNLYLIFFRGNHDNPEYFMNPEIRNTISTDRFILVPDYTIVSIDKINILCVGGAVSVDRRFRTTNSDYWYDEEMLDITNLENIRVDILLTHTVSKKLISPVLPPMQDWLKISFNVDKKLKIDSKREDMICNTLFEYYYPKLWYHGHYHISHRTPYDECIIIGVNINELVEVKYYENLDGRREND